MRIFIIVLAILFALLGARLILTGIRTIIMFIKMETIPIKAKESLFRDLFLGALFLILAFAMLT